MRHYCPTTRARDLNWQPDPESEVLPLDDSPRCDKYFQADASELKAIRLRQSRKKGGLGRPSKASGEEMVLRTANHPPGTPTAEGEACALGEGAVGANGVTWNRVPRW